MIPNELKQLTRWICWTKSARNGKPAKVPINPHTLKPASSTNQDTWSTFSHAQQVAQDNDNLGIGFVFSDTDDIVGIDLDHCINADGTWQDWATAIVNSFNTYTEVSPSGRGLHLFLRGYKPTKRCAKAWEGHRIEVYERARYFTITGDIVGSTATIERRQQQLDALCIQCFGREAAA